MDRILSLLAMRNNAGTGGGGGIVTFRLIRKVTIPEDISADASGVSFAEQSNGGVIFAFDTDENGEPFSLSELVIYSYAGTDHTSGSFCLDTTSAVPIYNHSGGFVSTRLSIGAKGAYSHSISRTTILNAVRGDGPSVKTTSYSTGVVFGGGISNVMSNAKTVEDLQWGADYDGTIRKINCFMENNQGYGFKPGSVFSFYGR